MPVKDSCLLAVEWMNVHAGEIYMLCMQIWLWHWSDGDDDDEKWTSMNTYIRIQEKSWWYVHEGCPVTEQRHGRFCNELNTQEKKINSYIGDLLDKLSYKNMYYEEAKENVHAHRNGNWRFMLHLFVFLIWLVLFCLHCLGTGLNVSFFDWRQVEASLCTLSHTECLENLSLKLKKKILVITSSITSPLRQN